MRSLLLACLLASPALAEGPAVLAVFDLELSGAKLDRATREGLNEYLFNKLAAQPAFKLVPRKEVAKRLTAEKSASYQACYDQSCQIEIGKELAAEKTLSTKILRLGRECTVSLVVYDLRTAATDAAADATGGCTAGQLARAIEAAVGKLRPAAPPAAAAPVAAVSGVVDEKHCPLAGTRRMGDPYPEGNAVTCIDGGGRVQGAQLTWHPNGQLLMKAEYKDSQLQGAFTTFHRNGAIMEKGQHERGKRVGTWVRYSDDGAKDEEGAYENGAKTGLWVRYERDGKKSAETEYKADQRHGTSVEYHRDGWVRLRGQYAADKREGTWVELRADGSKEEERTFKADRLNGQEVEYDAEGRRSVVRSWQDNELDGISERYSVRDGKAYLEWKTPYKAGKKDGVEIRYDQDGMESQHTTYARGQKHGPHVYFVRGKDGRPRKHEEGSYRDDKKVGRWLRFADDGEIDSEELWENGKREGLAAYYARSSRDGKRFKTQEGSYRGDKKDGTWRFLTPDGGVEREERYEQGKLVR